MNDAYHCRLLTPVKEDFAFYLAHFDFEEPRHAVFRNVDGQRYTKDTIVEGLSDHFDRPVLFQRGVERAVAHLLTSQSRCPFRRQDEGLTIIDVGSQGFLMKAVEDIELNVQYSKVVFNS